MADNKKYYYLKLKEDFFDSDEMLLLQGMKDGYLYSDILMKMYLRSLKNEGRLMYKDYIPYQDAFNVWFELLKDIPYQQANVAIQKYMLTEKFHCEWVVVVLCRW